MLKNAEGVDVFDDKTDLPPFKIDTD
jgi:hypothetical protein